LAGSTECSDQHAVLRALLRGAGYHPPDKWFSGIGQMKLWYQSLSYRAQTNPYGVVLARILASVADPDTTIHMQGVYRSAGIGQHYRLLEHHDTSEVIENALRA